MDVPGLDKKTIRFIDASQAFMILYTIAVAYLGAGAISASTLTLIVFPSYLLYTLITRNPLMQRLMVFGFVLGVVELIADHFAVVTADSLRYYADEEPMMVWTSPLYMPFAWTEVALQVALLGIRFTQRWGLAVASVVLALAGGAYVFFYENLAKSAGWWHYENVAMLWNTPYFISGAETLLFFVLPAVMLLIYKQPLWKAALWGAICSLWIWVTAYACHLLFS
ncbi:MAG TPA: hypothetical protein DCP28_36105 [Cytophagales bacterium]|nr:hypothetical protein [Cytophagales bacterium]